MSFWGLCIQSGKSYKQTVSKDYKVSQAVLDTSTVSSEEIISLQVDVNGSTFLLCNLSLDHGILQVPLECIFTKGEVVTFSIWSNTESEKAVVHITGHIKETSPSTNVSNGESPLTNVTNKKARNFKSSINRICINESPVIKGKENESASENKQKESKEDKNTVEKNKNKAKSKPEKKTVSLTDMLKCFDVNNEEEEEDDEEYSPEEEEAENEMEEEEEDDDSDDDEDEEEDDDDDDDEKEINLEEESEDDDVDKNEESVGIEEMEEDLKEKDEEEDKVLNDLPRKKKRRLSSSSAGRTPIPKAGKKQKIQDLSGSPTLTDSTLKKKKNKKKTASDITSVNEKVSSIKTPKESEKKKEAKNSSDEISDASPSSASKSNKRIAMGGVILEDLVIGTGAIATKGKKVSVNYEGKLKNGKVFDKSKSGSLFKFRLGANDVIKAWEIGVVGMKVGGKRRIVAPPAMAYGKEGAPPKIPPNSILTFEVELKGVN